MKTQLPKTINKNKEGFTLIELLIAITIVAILSVIAYSIFSNIQKGARDSQRRIEIDAIAKNVESTFNPATRTYNYTDNQYLADFPGGKPDDPLRNGGDPREYCVAVATATSTPPANPTVSAANPWGGPAGTAHCPSGYVPFTTKVNNPNTNPNMCDSTSTQNTCNPDTTAAPGDTVSSPVTATTTSWTVCAYLEASQVVYCKSSLQG